MIEDDLRAALQVESLGATVSPDALEALPGRMARRRRRRQVSQAGGIGVVVIALVASGLALGGGGPHRTTPTQQPEIVPTTLPAIQPSALAVLRTDGIHVGSKVLEGSRGATSLDASFDGRYVSWIHDSQGLVYDTKTGRSNAYGRTTAMAWSPTAEILAQGFEDDHGRSGLALSLDDGTLVPLAGSFAVNSLVWSPDGRRLVVGTVGEPLIVAVDSDHLDRTRSESRLNVPGPVLPAAFSPDGQTLYAWSSSASGSGSDLRAFQLLSGNLVGTITDLGPTAVRRDWLAPTVGGLFAIKGATTSPTGIYGPRGEVPSRSGGSPISLAFDAPDQLLARALVDARGAHRVVISHPDGSSTAIKAIDNAFGVMATAGGFLYVTLDHHLWSLRVHDGARQDLGPVDTEHALQDSTLRMPDVVVPARPGTPPASAAQAVLNEGGLAVVLRADGLHVQGPSGFRLIPGTTASRRLGLSHDGRFVSWLHDGDAFVSDAEGKVSDLGPADDAAWDPASDTLALASERGLELIRPMDSEGSFTPTGQNPIKDFVEAVLWDPAGGRLAAEVVPIGQPHRGGMIVVTVTGASPNDVSATILPNIPRCAKPAAWQSVPVPALLVRPDDACSESIAADGLPLESYALGGGAPTRLLESQLTYPDWIRVDGAGALVLRGGDREAINGKELAYLGERTSRTQILPATPAGQAVISFAVGSAGRVARVLVPSSANPGLPTVGTVVVNTPGGPDEPTTVPGISDARAVERAPGGFLIIGIDRLHEVYDDGSVRDLGPIDGSTNDYYGHVTPTDVVLPTLD